MEGSSTAHIRSISLPSRLNNNPSGMKIETKIKELRVLESSAVSTTQTIQSGLVGLAELYLCVEELVRSPQTQQALLRHRSATLVEDALEGSIGLLDSCSNLKDLLMRTKENVQVLQSALRRKGGDLMAASRIAAYVCFRKKAKKSVAKSLGTLKQLESKMGSMLLDHQDVDHHVSNVTKVLREVNALTVSLFKSLLVFVSRKTNKPTNGVRLISKLVSKSTRTREIDHTSINEVEAVDLALESLYKNARNGDNKTLDVQMMLRRLQILDVSIEGFEAGLDCLFRRLIQSRSSLLDIVAY